MFLTFKANSNYRTRLRDKENARRHMAVATWVVALTLAACQSRPESSPAAAREQEQKPAPTSQADAPAPLDQIDAESFNLRWSSPEAVPVGASGRGELVLTAKPPFKCNQEYPFKLKLKAAGLEPATAEVTKADMQVTPGRVTAPVAFKTSHANEPWMEATFAFSVCTDDRCLIEHQTLRLGAKLSASE
jgi:hypothetical protein